MNIGYARVSTKSQCFKSQLQLLEPICERVFSEKCSADGEDPQKQLEKLKETLRKGDTFIATSLDRVTRNIDETKKFIEFLEKNKVEFKFLEEPYLNSSNKNYRQMIDVVSLFNQYQLIKVNQTTKRGLKYAKSKGRSNGRPKGFDANAMKKSLKAKELYINADLSINGICKELEISKATLYKYLKFQGVNLRNNKKTKK